MRLFVGLSFTNNIRQTLHQLASGLDNARWVEPENYHLTLRFIGEVNNHDAGDVDLNLSAVDSEPFYLQFSGIGYFGKVEKPRSIWANIASNRALSLLQGKVERGVINSGFDAEGRRFRPHVTLARFRSRTPRNFTPYFSANGTFSTAPFLVSSFTLFESKMGRGGSNYLALKEYPLNT